jgi:acyl carrier protein
MLADRSAAAGEGLGMGRAALDRTVRSVLAKEARLSRPADALAGAEDLFDLGMDSHGAVRVMLALEDALGVEFPDDRLTRATFSSVNAIVEAIGACAHAA